MGKVHMDVVIPYRNSQSEELKYTLRGLKNIPHGKVFVIGDRTKYSVKHISYKHTPDIAQNTLEILRIACESPEVSNNFIWMNDDMMFLQPIEKLSVCHMGEYDELLKTLPKNNFYTMMKKATNGRLKSMGIEKPLFYDVHYPFVFNKKKTLAIINQMQGVNKISFYANYYKIRGKKIDKDFKVRGDEDHDDTFISTYDRTFNTNKAGKHIRDVLSEESPYEKFTVSVIMPTYNDAALIIRALDSIPDNVDEIIIVNDGSTDDTAELIEDWASKDKRAKVFTNKKNRGVGYTINRCYNEATSDYTVILSSDDYMHPTMRDIIGSIDGSDMVFFNLSYNIKGRIRRPNRANYKNWAGSCKLVRRDFMEGVRASNKLVNEDLELYKLLLQKPHTTQFTDIMGKHYNTPRLGSLTDRKQKGEFGEEYVTVGSEAYWRRYNAEKQC